MSDQRLQHYFSIKASALSQNQPQDNFCCSSAFFVGLQPDFHNMLLNWLPSAEGDEKGVFWLIQDLLSPPYEFSISFSTGWELAVCLGINLDAKAGM